MSAIRDQIANADDRSHEDVEVPEWGVTLRLVEPDVAERARLMEEWTADDGKVDFKKAFVLLLTATASDPESGELVFSSEDAEMLAGKSGRIVNKLFERASVISGLNAKAVDEGKVVSSETPSVVTASSSLNVSE